MKRTRARWLVLGWSVFVLLWVFVLAIVGEYLARGWLAAQWSRAEAISAVRAEQNRASMRAAFAGAAPEAATSDVNPFEVMSEAERVAWVVDRNEAAFVCDAAGKVLQAYVPGPVTPVHRLAAQMVPGQDLGQQLAERYVDQALAAPARSLHQSIADRLPVRIHWPQPMRYSGDAWDLFQFQSYPTLEKDSEAAAIVHLKQSVWETWAVAYRRNAVIPDSFEWSGEDLPTLSFSTNNLGFRGGSVAVPKPAGVYRIVCVGGSTTVEGPTGETTYPAILERRLREMIGTPNIEVVNAGVHGANSATVLSRAQDYLALEPDLVVEYNFINDYARYASSLQGASTGAAGWNPAMRLRAWLRHSSLAYMAWPALLTPGDAELGTYFETAIYDNLRALRGALARGGAEVCFASFAYPDPGGLSPDERAHFEFMHYKWNFKKTVMDLDGYVLAAEHYNRALELMCQETGAAYLPVGETLKKHPEYFTDICHFTHDGIRQKAELIAGLLHERVAEGVRKKTGSTPASAGGRAMLCGVGND